MRRPLIAIPGRFSASASSLRFAAVVNARKLLEAVYRAGGEPLTVFPDAAGAEATPDEVGARLGWVDGVLLPGGGDLDPSRYGQEPMSERLYDVNHEQDAFDLAVAVWAARRAVPILAICRGLHVVNAARGGDLEQHMDHPHRHVTHSVRATHPLLARAVGDEEVQISCYHHQRVGRLASGLTTAAVAADGTVEAVVDVFGAGWFLGVQWHPEDMAEVDSAQGAIFGSFVAAAAEFAAARATLT